MQPAFLNYFFSNQQNKIWKQQNTINVFPSLEDELIESINLRKVSSKRIMTDARNKREYSFIV